MRIVWSSSKTRSDADPDPGGQISGESITRVTPRVSVELFAPCEALMRRLKLAQKFALIAVVLIAPLAFVTYSYVSAQGKHEAFSIKERAGLIAVRPLVALLGAVAEARSGAAHSNPAGVLRRAGGGRRQSTPCWPSSAASSNSLGRGRRSSARSRRRLRLEPATGPRAVAAWDHVSRDAVKLIAEAADKSNLTLDPDLDTYYLQDTIDVRVPTLLDAGGRGRRPRRARSMPAPVAVRSRSPHATVASTAAGHRDEHPEGRRAHDRVSPRAVSRPARWRRLAADTASLTAAQRTGSSRRRAAKVLHSEPCPVGEPTRPGRRRTVPRGPDQASM